MNANKYLQDIGLENVIDEEFFNDDDKSWYKVQELMESYHQAKLKLLGIGDVVGRSEQLVCPRCSSNKIAPSEDHHSFTDCEHCGMTWAN